MAQKIPPSPQPERSDVGTDYVLIAVAAGAAVVALIYLILLQPHFRAVKRTGFRILSVTAAEKVHLAYRFFVWAESPGNS